MASEGPLSPATISSTSGHNWSNLSNATSSDDAYATVIFSSSTSPSYALIASDFGFNIPTGDIIDGVLFEVECKVNNTAISMANRGLMDVSTETTLGTEVTTTQALTTSDTYYSTGGASDTFSASLTPAIVNSSDFGVYVRFTNAAGFSLTASVDHVRVTVYHTTGNTAPTITVAPTAAYGSLTRLGPNNTPAVVSFTATDAEETGADELSYEIRTATGGGGTLVASGTCTSGASKNVNIAYNASGLSGNGSQTLYLVVDDGTDSDEESFSLLQDNVAPSVGAVTTTPTTVRP